MIEELIKIIPEWSIKDNSKYAPGDIVYTQPHSKIHFHIRSSDEYCFWIPISIEDVLERYPVGEQINIF